VAWRASRLPRRLIQSRRRAPSTGAASFRGATRTGAANFRPQQNGSDPMEPTRARWSAIELSVAGRVSLEVRVAPPLCVVDPLCRGTSPDRTACDAPDLTPALATKFWISYLWRRGGAGSSGCFDTRPRRAPACWAMRRSPSLFSQGRALGFVRVPTPAHRREAPARAAAWRGPAPLRRWGKGRAPPRRTGEDSTCSGLGEFAPAPGRTFARGRQSEAERAPHQAVGGATRRCLFAVAQYSDGPHTHDDASAQTAVVQEDKVARA
jgi:hypothetical protein